MGVWEGKGSTAGGDVKLKTGSTFSLFYSNPGDTSEVNRKVSKNQIKDCEDV